MKRNVAAVAFVSLWAASAAAGPPIPPPQAADAGYTEINFNSDWSEYPLAAIFSCAGDPTSRTWEQGLWWDTDNGGVLPPCSQIKQIWDQVFVTYVLDLVWTRDGNQNPSDLTAISTMPLNRTDQHFTFRHGYIEIVARMPVWASGLWSTFWTLTDASVIGGSFPPYLDIPKTEFDIMEMAGTNGGWFDTAIHEFYPGGNNNYIDLEAPPPFDPTQPHTYGLLWTDGWACSYRDNVQIAPCQPTTSGTEALDHFLIVSMGVGCSGGTAPPRNRSCVAVDRGDLLVQRITQFGIPGHAE